MSTQMMVINQTGHVLSVTGKRGDDVHLAVPNQHIGVGASAMVATFNAKSGSDRWDWVLLEDATTQQKFQIYIEQTVGGTHYTFFGYFNADSSESDSNPSPFPEGCADALWSGGSIAYYTLLKTPPPES